MNVKDSFAGLLRAIDAGDRMALGMLADLAEEANLPIARGLRGLWDAGRWPEEGGFYWYKARRPEGNLGELTICRSGIVKWRRVKPRSNAILAAARAWI